MLGAPHEILQQAKGSGEPSRGKAQEALIEEEKKADSGGDEYGSDSVNDKEAGIVEPDAMEQIFPEDEKNIILKKRKKRRKNKKKQ